MSIKLFCVPYAGGTAEVFTGLKEYLNDDIELVCIEYSGHGKRAKEPFYKTFDEMVKDTAGAINSQLEEGENFARFGYSMGSVVCFECMINGLLKGEPSYFLIASHEAPGEHWESMDYAVLDDMAFFKKIVEFGGFKAEDERRMENRFFRKLIFDPIKADYDLIAQYELKSLKKLDVPVTMMYSPDDVKKEAAALWQNRFEKKIEFIEIGENHFFINTEQMRVAKIINERICI